MRIAIFGATGRTGQHVVVEALTRGHSVVGISRRPPDPNAATQGPRIPWHTADALDAAAVRQAIGGADAVVICLGPSGDDDTTCGRATRIIVDAMRELGIERLACQTGAMIGHEPARLSWILYRIRTAWRSRNPEQARDRDAQELTLRSSRLRTTIVRPTRLTDGAKTPALVSPDAFVSAMATSRYEDVAAALIDGVEGRLDRDSDRGRGHGPVGGVVTLSRPALDAGFLARWTVAHSVGEMLGLGAVGIAAMVARSVAHGSIAGTLALGAVAGVVEGVLVAGLLGAVLVSARPEVRFGSWLRWTIAGAVICWGLGMLPSALMHAQSAPGVGASAEEPSRAWMMLGAMGLGLFAGPLLGALQFRALRPLGIRLREWIAATSIGWVVGMPVVFLAAGEAWTSAATIARGLLLLATAGALVGLATGAGLMLSDRARSRGRAKPRASAREPAQSHAAHAGLAPSPGA